MRIFADWAGTKPGFRTSGCLEADLVAHCCHRAEDAFLYSLVWTDVTTGWTECLPLLFRTQEAVIQVRYGLVSTELHRRPDRSLENEGNQYLVNGIGA